MKVFVIKKTPKAPIQMLHVPQFIAYTNFPLGFTSEQVVEAQLVLRRVVPQVSHQ